MMELLSPKSSELSSFLFLKQAFFLVYLGHVDLFIESLFQFTRKRFWELRKVTRATIEVHTTFFFWGCSIWELKRPLPKTDFGEDKKRLPVDEKSHGLGTQRESCKKKIDLFPTDLG